MKRRQHSEEFRARVLQQAKRDGVTRTAIDRDLSPGLIYAWRKKAKQIEVVQESNRQLSDTAFAQRIEETRNHQADYIRSLQAEIGRLHMLLCAKKP